MIPCKEIVFILSSDAEISWMKRAELKMHLMMCRHCSNYSVQLGMLKNGFIKLFSEMASTSAEEVKNLEDEIIRKIP
jgi:hypothetical protein